MWLLGRISHQTLLDEVLELSNTLLFYGLKAALACEQPFP